MNQIKTEKTSSNSIYLTSLLYYFILSQNVYPDPKQHCGPYKPVKRYHEDSTRVKIDRFNHDTIGMVAIDDKQDIAAGTSTNGAKFKIPG